MKNYKSYKNDISQQREVKYKCRNVLLRKEMKDERYLKKNQ